MSPFQSIIAGMIAGAVEASITYPTEFVKTQLQLQGKMKQAIQVAENKINSTAIHHDHGSKVSYLYLHI